MTLLSESARTAKIRLQRTTVAAVRKRLTAELQDLNALNREITIYVREVRHVVRNLKSGKNGRALKSASRRSRSRVQNSPSGVRKVADRRTDSGAD